MKKLISAALLAALLASLLCAAHAATKVYEPDENNRDYSAAGWYRVFSIIPEDHDYSYIYDKPSSTKGDSQCRADDGEWIYVYYVTSGSKKNGALWAYCSFDNARKGRVYEGFLRYANLVASDEYDPCAPKPTATPKATAKPPKQPSYNPPQQPSEIPLLEMLTVVNCKHWVSLREAPNASSRRLAKVPFGTELLGYSYNKYWYACTYDGMFGYIGADYLI